MLASAAFFVARDHLEQIVDRKLDIVGFLRKSTARSAVHILAEGMQQGIGGDDGGPSNERQHEHPGTCERSDGGGSPQACGNGETPDVETVPQNDAGPRKPMPENDLRRDTCGISAGFLDPWIPMGPRATKSTEPTETSAFVRIPAVHSRHWRLRPMAAPSAIATMMRSEISSSSIGFTSRSITNFPSDSQRMRAIHKTGNVPENRGLWEMMQDRNRSIRVMRARRVHVNVALEMLAVHVAI